MLIDGNDNRGIDVGVYSKFPITDVNTHIFDRPSPNSRSRIFSRDCLEVEIAISPRRRLWLLANHLKSKFGGSSDSRRRAQAVRVAEIVKRFDLERDRVIVAGDLNDTPDPPPLDPLLRVRRLTDVLATANVPVAERWTFKDKRSQLDYLLVSERLTNELRSAHVLRRGIFFRRDADRDAHKTYPTFTSSANAASDHAAVVATFDI